MGAKMFDGALMKAANIQQKSRYVNENVTVIENNSPRREDYLKVLRIMDEQDAVNRYRWFNIPAELSSQEIERMLYYRGQLCFFFYQPLGKFYFMPYALDGSIDFYGRYNTIHPVPFASGNESKADSLKSPEEKAIDANVKAQKDILSLIRLTCVYDVMEEDEVDDEVIEKSTVLLHDYTKQRSELIIPRQALNECILSSMADIVCYFDNAMLIGSGVEGYRVETADAVSEVKRLAGAMYKSAINKTPYVAVSGTINFQELTTGSKKYAVADFLMGFQGLDNLRLSTYGISNGGVYEKKAHTLEKEMEINNSNMYSPEQDGISIRQRFCNIVNSIWGTEIWCEPAEAVIGMDLNGDGVDYDRDEDIQEEGGEEDGLE